MAVSPLAQRADSRKFEMLSWVGLVLHRPQRACFGGEGQTSPVLPVGARRATSAVWRENITRRPCAERIAAFSFVLIRVNSW